MVKDAEANKEAIKRKGRVDAKIRLTVLFSTEKSLKNMETKFRLKKKAIETGFDLKNSKKR